uniref:Uncharacterized protein n=1 Tax=Anguilla anguilla TaxID=7936 RepID=A0A0E9RAD8_ANGAN
MPLCVCVCVRAYVCLRVVRASGWVSNPCIRKGLLGLNH